MICLSEHDLFHLVENVLSKQYEITLAEIVKLDRLNIKTLKIKNLRVS